MRHFCFTLATFYFVCRVCAFLRSHLTCRQSISSLGTVPTRRTQAGRQVCFVPFGHGCLIAPVAVPTRAQRTYPVNVLGLGQTMCWALGSAVAAPGLAEVPWTESSPPTFRSPNSFAQVKTGPRRAFPYVGFDNIYCLINKNGERFKIVSVNSLHVNINSIF